MRSVVQRVNRAKVTIAGDVVGEIAIGFCVLLGVATDDTAADADAMAAKIAGLRIFPDAAGALNEALPDAGGAVLLISQFTLLGDARHGRRPSFIAAARGAAAETLYERVAEKLRATGLTVETGRFGADMAVELVNDGPITILLDTKRTF